MSFRKSLPAGRQGTTEKSFARDKYTGDLVS
jgi:hypothetical protein